MEESQSGQISTVCRNLSYEPRVDGDSQHHDVDWQMQLRIEAYRPLEETSAHELLELARQSIEETVAFCIWGKAPKTMRAWHEEGVSPRAHLGYEVAGERQRQWESHHQPFLAQYDLSGTLSLDTQVPVSGDEALLIAKRAIAFDIANRLAATILEDLDQCE